jgi:hypothetical protein
MSDLTRQEKSALRDIVPSFILLRVDTTPLTPWIISKKHIRILGALLTIKRKDQSGSDFTSTDGIREHVALSTGKLYPYIDINSFANDLHIRGYVDLAAQVDTEEDVAVSSYRINNSGESLLQSMAQ